MDDIERGQVLDGMYREQALAAHAARQKSEGGMEVFYCEDCEDPIPEARRRASKGCTRCVDCQQEVDDGGRGFWS